MRRKWLLPDDFQRCAKCNRIIDTFRESLTGGLCVTCARSDDPSIPPWPEHMMQTIEPYIQYRINIAMQEVASGYLKTSQERVQAFCVDE